MGIEPSPAPANAGQGPTAERRREVHPRTDRAVARLGQCESVSVGNQLGKHTGGCFPQFVVDLGGPVAGGSARAPGVSRGNASSSGVSRALYRAISIYLFLSEHAPTGGSGGAVLSWHSLPPKTP